jgi:hypothetical protein
MARRTAWPLDRWDTMTQHERRQIVQIVEALAGHPDP